MLWISKFYYYTNKKSQKSHFGRYFLGVGANMTEITSLHYHITPFSKFIQKSSIVKTECRNWREYQETFHMFLFCRRKNTDNLPTLSLPLPLVRFVKNANEIIFQPDNTHFSHWQKLKYFRDINSWYVLSQSITEQDFFLLPQRSALYKTRRFWSSIFDEILIRYSIHGSTVPTLQAPTWILSISTNQATKYNPYLSSSFLSSKKSMAVLLGYAVSHAY